MAGEFAILGDMNHICFWTNLALLGAICATVLLLRFFHRFVARVRSGPSRIQWDVRYFERLSGSFRSLNSSLAHRALVKERGGEIPTRHAETNEPPIPILPS